MVQSTEGGWKYKLPGEQIGFFSGDNRYYIYQTGDSLCNLSLGTGTMKLITRVVDYKLSSGDTRNEWIAVELKEKTVLLKNFITGKEKQFTNVINYEFDGRGDWFSCQLNNATKELVTVQLSTEKVHNYEHVSGYRFDQSKRILVLQTDHEGIKGLEWVNTRSGKTTTVWRGNPSDSSSIGGYLVDQSAERLVFTVQLMSTGKIERSIWYFKEGMTRAVQKVSRNTSGIREGLEISGWQAFSDNGKYIIVSMRDSAIDNRKAQRGAVQVDVWNYKDTFLMSSQLDGNYGPMIYSLRKKELKLSVPCEGGGALTYLAGIHEQLFSQGGREYALVERSVKTDRFWEDWAASESCVVNLRDGKRIRLRKSISMSRWSPDGTWLLCYDGKEGKYFRYDIASGLYTDLSGGEDWYFGGENEYNGTGRQSLLSRGIVGWLEGGTGLLVYDHYDIWQLDVTGKKRAVNLTNGRKDNIRFEITGNEFQRKTFYDPHERLLLTAVNMINKDNGFYALKLGSPKVPERLCMGPYVLYLGGLSYGTNFWGRYSKGRSPLKARDADTWLI
ncbi:MAG: hypothetical protein J7497_14210, partial [Chitinophagaceae bacterium]|nr:hypothetical protein [Chitinophagaceae bacterium]